MTTADLKALVGQLEAQRDECAAAAAAIRRAMAALGMDGNSHGLAGRAEGSRSGAPPRRRARAARTAPPARQIRVSDDALIALVRKHQGVTNAEAARAFGVGEGTTFPKFRRLVAAGTLTQGGDKKYRIVVTQGASA